MVPLVFYLVAAGRHFSHRHRASLRPYNPPFRLNEQREYPQNVGIFAVSVLEIIKQNLKEKKKAQKANYHTHTPKYMRVGVPCFFFALFHILIFSLSIVFVTNSFLFKKKTGHREGNVRTFRSPFIKIEVNNFLANFFFDIKEKKTIAAPPATPGKNGSSKEISSYPPTAVCVNELETKKRNVFLLLYHNSWCVISHLNSDFNVYIIIIIENISSFIILPMDIGMPIAMRIYTQ